MAATAVVLGAPCHWWLAVTIPAHALVTYAMFTVLHDSIHHTVGQPKWVNDLFGRLSMPFVALWSTYPALSYVHIEHHRNTNEDPLSDPDAWVHTGPHWRHPFRCLTIDAWYSRFYLPRLRHRPRKEIVGVVISQRGPFGQGFHPAGKALGVHQHRSSGDTGSNGIDPDAMATHSTAATFTNMSTPALDTQ